MHLKQKLPIQIDWNLELFDDNCQFDNCIYLPVRETFLAGQKYTCLKQMFKENNAHKKKIVRLQKKFLLHHIILAVLPFFANRLIPHKSSSRLMRSNNRKKIAKIAICQQKNKGKKELFLKMFRPLFINMNKRL